MSAHFVHLKRLAGSLVGRQAGWNIITSATGEKSYGAAPLPDQDVRYEQAAEFVEINKRLWDSWDEQTLKIDRASGVFGDSSDILPTDFHGKFFDVSGPLNIQRPPQGWPVLFQAGALTTAGRCVNWSSSPVAPAATGRSPAARSRSPTRWPSASWPTSATAMW